MTIPLRTSLLLVVATSTIGLLVVTTSLTSVDDCQPSPAQPTTPLPLPRLLLPPPRGDNLTLALCACMRQEEHVVDEWVDFHLGIGVAHIHIYDNTETFELQQWAYERRVALGDPVTITHVPEHAAVQRRVYRQCAEFMAQLQHDYVLFADVDEFLVVRDRVRYPHPMDLILELAPTGALAVETMVFGSANRRNYQPIPVTKRFQYKTHDKFRMNKKTKSIVHLASFNWNVTEFASPHYPPILRTSSSQVHWAPRRTVLLYHYQFKSQTEFVRKYQKGSAWYGQRQGLQQALDGTTSRGEPIPNGTRFDDTAWKILKSVAPRYALYDQFYKTPPFAPGQAEEAKLTSL